ELPLEAALVGRRLGATIALDGAVELAERHHRLGGVAAQDRASVVIEGARPALGIGERVFVGAGAREDEAEVGGDALRLGAAGVETACLFELDDGALAALGAAG